MDVRKKTTAGAIANLPSDLGMIQLTTSKSLQHKVDAKYATRILEYVRKMQHSSSLR